MRVAAILEAVRVLPKKESVDILRATLEAWEAMASNSRERMEAQTLSLLIELHDKVRAALEEPAR